MDYEEKEMIMSKFWAKLWTAVILGVAVVIVIMSMGIMPVWSVWSQGLRGKAALKEAEWNRQILIEEAQAKKLSATHLAQAEIERAKGVAEANKIIGDSLRGNDAYLRYLWIQGLHDGSSETIYIPTEANLPVLEAGRLNAMKEVMEGKG
jgi:type II secretory pathway pseudopilin PulG